MFDRGCDDFIAQIAFKATNLRRAGETIKDGIVGFTAASDEDNFIGRGADEICDNFTGLFDFLACDSTDGMKTGGITINIEHFSNSIFDFWV
jgi:hypothetical protein